MSEVSSRGRAIVNERFRWAEPSLRTLNQGNCTLLVSQNGVICGFELELMVDTVLALVVEETVGVFIPGDGLDIDAG